MALRRPGRVFLRSPRQGLGVNVLPDLCQLAVLNGDVEDPIVLERLVRGFDPPRRHADDQNPISLRYVFPGLRGRFDLFGGLAEQVQHARMPAVCSGKRPVLTWNDPRDVWSHQRQQTVPVAAADGGEEILYGLNILFGTHRTSPFPSHRIARVPNPAFEQLILFLRLLADAGSDLGHATIDGELHAGNVSTFIRGEE